MLLHILSLMRLDIPMVTLNERIGSTPKIGGNIIMANIKNLIIIIFILLLSSCGHKLYYFIPLNENLRVEFLEKHYEPVSIYVEDDNYRIVISGGQFGTLNGIELKLLSYEYSIRTNINDLKIKDNLGTEYDFIYKPNLWKDTLDYYPSSQPFDLHIHPFDSSVTDIKFFTAAYFNDERYLILELPELIVDEKRIIKPPEIRLKFLDYRGFIKKIQENK